MRRWKSTFGKSLSLAWVAGVLVSAVLAGGPGQVLAANFYVGGNGASDYNPGTASQPFATIRKAASMATAGDQVIIRAGVYRETIRPTNSGLEGQPIIFSTFTDEQVIITGTEPVVNWQRDAGDIWKAQVASPVSQVFINDAQAEKARFPNAGYTPYDVDTWVEVELTADRRGTMKGIGAIGDLKNARVVAFGASRWVTVTGVISSLSGESFTVTKTSKQWSAEAPHIYLGKGVGYLIDHKALLDAPGEWFYENDVLYLIPPKGSDPNTLAVEARMRSKGADLNDRSYIHLIGLNFTAANVTMRKSYGCVMDGCTVRYPTPFFAFTNGFNRDGMNADAWEGNGVEVSGSYNVIRNGYIAHSWGDGVTMWSDGNTLENCLVEDCNWMAVDSAPLCVTGQNHIIVRNTLRTAARSILVHRHNAATDILYNDLYNCGIMCDDLGLTYTFQSDGKGSIIAYNWVHDNRAPHTAPGIYLDNGSSNFHVHHNVVWSCGESIRLNLPQTNTDVFNNTLWANRKGMGVWGPDGTKMTNVRTWNNIQDHAAFEGNDLSNNLFTTENQFVDSANGDFRLKADAKAVDYGKIIPGITDGYVGSAPDAGAYEYGGAAWRAGSTVQPPILDDSTPTAPAGLHGEVSLGKIRLFWHDLSNNETGFAVDRRREGAAFEQIGAVAANVSQFTDSTVAPLTTYTYRIRAFNAAGSAASAFLVITSASDGSSLRLEAEAYDQMSGISNNGDSIGSCDEGDWVMFKSVDFGEGFDLLTARVAVPAEYAGRTVVLRLDKRNGQLVGRLKAAATGGWNTFEEQSVSIERFSGVHDLYILFIGGYGVGNFDWFQFSQSITDVQIGASLPDFYLAQNYPNPFNPVTQICYELPTASMVTLEIYDTLGRRVRLLAQERQHAGSYSAVWNGQDDGGRQVAAGVYFYRLRAQSGDRTFEKSHKMLMIK